jgi:hypothetical protein
LDDIPVGAYFSAFSALINSFALSERGLIKHLNGSGWLATEISATVQILCAPPNESTYPTIEDINFISGMPLPTD